MRRHAAVAGTWYPDDPETLTRAVDRYVGAGRTGVTIRPLIALIAPHAGLVYSGPVAGFAYAALAAQPPELVVLVGPSHYVAFDGVAVWPGGVFETPLGPMRVDADTAAALLARCPGAVDLPAAHTREHSLEMQLPFLARTCGEVPIVPIVMGLQERPTIEALGRALADLIGSRRAVLIASSDLSHFFDAATATRLDRRVADLVEAFDPEGLLEELERYPEHERGRFVMCGGGPAVSVMIAARALGATDARVLASANSGDVSGDYHRVVGYLAASIGGVVT
jgi:AmmeMemoRadiSam system protein B